MKTRVFGTLLGALIVASSLNAQVPAGGEFRVNNATYTDLAYPRVAADPSGAFVVVWADFGKPAAVTGRRFDPTGAPIGGEFLVNEDPVVGGQRPHVAVDATGRALAVWSNPAGFGVAPGVFGRVFDGAGRPVGSEFEVSSTGAYEPSVAVTPSGFIVAWSTDAVKDDSGGVRARRIDVAGNPLGPEFQVNANAAGYQYMPSVTAVETGGFVVAWASYGAVGPEVRARRFGAGGTPLGRELRVSTSAGFGPRPAVAMAGDASFVVVWTSGAYVRGRRYSAADAPLGEEFVVNPAPAPGLYTASVASDKSGNFTVLWEAGSVGALDVSGRRFTATGEPRGAEFPVNTERLGNQERPDVAMDGTGNLFATWIGTQESSIFQVFGQRVGGLVAAGMVLEDGDNRVLEVGDDFTLVTSWTNVNGSAQSFQGGASGVTAPPKLLLTLSPDADYGTVPDGTTGSCSSTCFEGSLTGTRPEGHLDLGLVETLQPDAQGQGKRWRVHVGETFADVPSIAPFYGHVETLVHHGITGGCAASAYCPSNSTTREQMAVFVLVGKEGAGYRPPPCGAPAFGDVPASSPFCPWVEEVARRGAAVGCGDEVFCPDVPITREQMAVLVQRVFDPLLDPPACTTPMFDDVPASSPFCPWIEALARLSPVVRCSATSYCPSKPVTREEMAMFIAETFGLELYGPYVGHVPWRERARTPRDAAVPAAGDRR